VDGSPKCVLLGGVQQVREDRVERGTTDSVAVRVAPRPTALRQRTGALDATRRTLRNCLEVKNLLHNHDPKPRGFLA
jgi:hypothetical protein